MTSWFQKIKLFFRPKNGHKPDYVIIFCIAFLIIFGLIVLSSASSDLGKRLYNDTYYYLVHQLLYGVGLGLIGFFITSQLYYRHYKALSFWLLLVSIGGLVLVFTHLGISAKGAERWFQLGPISVQPAEIVKITFIIYLAAWLSNKTSERQKSFMAGFLPFLAISGIIAFLLLIQPATSIMVIIMLSALIVYFMSGAKVSYILNIFLLGAVVVAAMVFITPYRFERVANFMHPENDIYGSGFHRNQALIAVGSGGLFGVGYGQSASKYNSLPEPIGDSIFAVSAEEFGFIGGSLIIFIFALLVIRIFILAKNTRDQFGRLILIGFGSIIGLQTFINIGAISGILPITGIPLPFISYGGSAMVIFLTMSGIIVNISKYS